METNFKKTMEMLLNLDKQLIELEERIENLRLRVNSFIWRMIKEEQNKNDGRKTISKSDK